MVLLYTIVVPVCHLSRTKSHQYVSFAFIMGKHHFRYFFLLVSCIASDSLTLHNFSFTGRAWLFIALNESLLESYIRCFQQNEKLTEEYYVSDALVRDQQVL